MKCKKNKVCKVVRKKGNIFVSMLLILTMLMSMMILPASAETSCYSNDTKLINTDNVISAEEIVDGTVVKCTYNKKSEEYNLSLDNNNYPLIVDIIDNCAYVSFAKTNSNSIDIHSDVVSQYGIELATAPYWAPAVLAAVKTVIGYVVVGTATVVGTLVAVEAVDEIVSDIKTGELSKSKSKSKTYTAAYTKVKNAKKINATYYYEAELINYTTYINLKNPISYSAALKRLKSGKDVYASDRNAAKTLAKKASPVGQIRDHSVLRKIAAYELPHFHPVGISWKNNPLHMPHSMFPGF